MNKAFDYNRTLSFLKAKVKVAYPASTNYNELADDIYRATQPVKEQNPKGKNNFRTTVKRWFSDNGKGLPTTPEYLLVLAQLLHTTIEAIFLGEELPDNSAHLSYYSVAKSDNPNLYLPLKNQCPYLFGAYDEFNQRFIDYILQFRAAHLLAMAFKEEDLGTAGVILIPESDINTGALLPVLAKDFNPELFNQVYRPFYPWVSTLKSRGCLLNITVVVDPEILTALLPNPEFLEIATKTYNQEQGQRNRALFVPIFSRNPLHNRLPYLHGAFNLAFAQAIISKDLTLIRLFLVAGTAFNNAIVKLLPDQKELFVKQGCLCLSKHDAGASWSLSNVAYPDNVEELRLLENDSLISAYFDSLMPFTRVEVTQ